MIRKSKRKGFSKVWSHKVKKIFMFFFFFNLSIFYFNFDFVQYDVNQVWWNSVKHGGCLYALFWTWLQIRKHNLFLEDTNTYEVSNLTTIKKNIPSTNFSKTLNEPKNLDISHRTPPYNPNLIWPPTQNPQTRHLLRPIISSIDSATHKIAHVIAKLLTPAIRHNQPLTH